MKLTQTAKQISQEGSDAPQIRALEQEIELESLLIDARNREIEGLSRELESLRAKASLSGATPFRSLLLVKFPYAFVREAIASANRLVPKRDRREKLISELGRETEKLEQLKKELRQIHFLQGEKEKGKPTLKGSSSESSLPAPAVSSSPAAPDRAILQNEIQSLEKELTLKQESYKYERERFQAIRLEKLSSELPSKR